MFTVEDGDYLDGGPIARSIAIATDGTWMLFSARLASVPEVARFDDTGHRKRGDATRSNRCARDHNPAKIHLGDPHAEAYHIVLLPSWV